jgi:hypothetical protein
MTIKRNVAIPKPTIQRPRLTYTHKATKLFWILNLAFGFLIMPLEAQTPDAQRLAHPDWVQIPGELIRPDCVHEVPNGASIEVSEKGEPTGDVRLNGVLIAHYNPCPEPAIITRPVERTESSYSEPATQGGWVEASQWNVSLSQTDNIDFVAGYWTVPPPPALNGGLIYLFNGIGPSNFQWILQPVLQYGKGYAGGGNYWAIASWLANTSGGYHSSLQPVSPGHLIFGATQITSTSGNTLNWQVKAEDTTTGVSSVLNVSTTGYHWAWAYAAVLEAYYITSCSQLPSNGSDSFTASSVDHGFPTFTYITPQDWYGQIYSYGGPSCGFAVSPGNTSTLYY